MSVVEGYANFRPTSQMRNRDSLRINRQTWNGLRLFTAERGYSKDARTARVHLREQHVSTVWCPRYAPDACGPVGSTRGFPAGHRDNEKGPLVGSNPRERERLAVRRDGREPIVVSQRRPGQLAPR